MTPALSPLTFPLNGIRLIEAGAGTGKTYTIAALYLRLILNHGGDNSFGRPLMPPDILVVTFTNAATQELRERIRSRLSQAASFFRGDDPGDPFLVSLGNDHDPTVWPSLARRMEQAAQWMDEAAVFTIHSWCRRMLRRYAFNSASLFDLELIASEADLLESAACDVWRSMFYPMPQEKLALVRHRLQPATPAALLKRVKPLLDADLPETREISSLVADLSEINTRARLAWAGAFEHIAGLLSRARENKDLNGNMYRAASLANWLAEMENWMCGDLILPSEKALEKLSVSGLKRGRSKNGTVPVHPAFDALEDLRRFLEENDLETTVLIQCGREIKQRVIAEKERKAATGFDDLLNQLADALERPGNEDLSRMIREQFPVALVDEFQDTDPVQYRVLKRLYPDESDIGFFMIGDPKQAIYAFRGADIHTYLMARRDADGRIYALDTNYRSTQGMVSAVNHLFGRIAHHPEGPFLFKTDIPFLSVKARGRPERFFTDGGFPSPLTLWTLDADEPVNKTGEGGYLYRMASVCAGFISSVLAQGRSDPPRAGFTFPDGRMTPVAPADIAVLVRSADQARIIRTALGREGVTSVYLSDRQSVFETREAGDLLILMRACRSPREERRVRSALGTSLLSCTYEYLDRLSRDETAWEKATARFFDCHRIWQVSGILPMIRALIHQWRISRRLSSMAGGERILTNVLHLAELLQEASRSLEGPDSLIRWLEQRISGLNADEDIAQMRLESDENLVRVVTVHKSKGLEYPLVFLPFICADEIRSSRSKQGPVVRRDDRGGLELLLSPDDDVLAQMDREQLAEELRLIYVALTRSCHACFAGIGVTGSVTSKGEKNTFHCSGIGHIITRGSPMETREVMAELQALAAGCEAVSVTPLPVIDKHGSKPTEKKPPGGRARRFSRPGWDPWTITSYSGISAGASPSHAGSGAADGSGQPLTRDVPDAPDSAQEDQLLEEPDPVSTLDPEKPATPGIHTFSRGAEPGIFLHDLMEWAANCGFGYLHQHPEEIASYLYDTGRPLGWEDWIEALTRWCRELLDLALPLPDSGSDPCRFKELHRSACRAEMEFLFPAHHVDLVDLDRLVTDGFLPRLQRPCLSAGRVNGMLKGYIDLTFCSKGRYYVMDYKSNYLGPSTLSYNQAAMEAAMVHHRYDLQLMLYTLALHRLLKYRIPEYEYDRHVGGGIYLFLRGAAADGSGVFGFRPEKQVIEALDNAFAGKERS